MDISRLQHGLYQHHPPIGRDVGAAPSLALKPHLDSPTSLASPSSMSTGHGHGHTHTYPRHPAPHGHNHDAESVDYRELSDERSPVNGDEPSRKKQKRNKPTLSCHECVERKTKVRLYASFQMRRDSRATWALHLSLYFMFSFCICKLLLLSLIFSFFRPLLACTRHGRSISIPPIQSVTQHPMLSLIAPIYLCHGTTKG